MAGKHKIIVKFLHILIINYVHYRYLTDEGLQKLRMAANTDDVHKLKEEAVNVNTFLSEYFTLF